MTLYRNKATNWELKESIIHHPKVCLFDIKIFLSWRVAQWVKRLPTMRETRVQSLGWEDPLEKEMATHSSSLAWKIPWTEKPGRLQSVGSQRVGHDWATSLHFTSEEKTSKPCVTPRKVSGSAKYTGRDTLFSFLSLKKLSWDFRGSPVVKTTLPMQGAWVRSLVRELDPTCHS